MRECCGGINVRKNRERDRDLGEIKVLNKTIRGGERIVEKVS